MPTCGTAWPHTSYVPDGDQSIRLGARRRTHTADRTAYVWRPLCRRNARTCRRQGDPSKPRVGDAPGSSGPSRCSFSLPLRPRRISVVRQGCYRALPMGWRRRAHSRRSAWSSVSADASAKARRTVRSGCPGAPAMPMNGRPGPRLLGGAHPVGPQRHRGRHPQPDLDPTSDGLTPAPATMLHLTGKPGRMITQGH